MSLTKEQLDGLTAAIAGVGDRAAVRAADQAAAATIAIADKPGAPKSLADDPAAQADFALQGEVAHVFNVLRAPLVPVADVAGTRPRAAADLLVQMPDLLAREVAWREQAAKDAALQTYLKYWDQRPLDFTLDVWQQMLGALVSAGILTPELADGITAACRTATPQPPTSQLALLGLAESDEVLAAVAALVATT